MTAKPDCTACGVCCISPQDQQVFCDVTEADVRRLGASLVKRHVHFPQVIDQLTAVLDGARGQPYGAIETRWTREKYGPFKTWEFCRCVFLQGTLLKRVKCRVYDKRPRACHVAVKPGDRMCKELRRAFQQALDDLKEEQKDNGLQSSAASRAR